MNEYDILDIKPTATKDEITAAYRKMVKMHHPDKGGNPEMFKKVVAAYNTIISGSINFSGKKDISTGNVKTIKAFHRNERIPSLKKGFFGKIFGFMEKLDINYDCVCDLADMIHEKNTSIDIKRIRKCVCNDGCKLCDNTGHRYENKTIKLKLPNEFENDSTIIYDGGHYVNGKKGKIMLHMHITYHRHFTKVGADIHTLIKKSSTELAAGMRIKFLGINDNILYCDIDKGTRLSDSYIIRNAGLLKNNGTRGNQVLWFDEVYFELWYNQVFFDL